MIVGATSFAQAQSPSKADLDKLQGTWETVSIVRDGRKVEADRLKDRVLVIDGSTFVDKSGDRIHGKGTITVDASGDPKTIDAAFTEGPIKGMTSLGIYRLEGDKLTSCAAVPKKDRPTEFESKSGTGGWLVVYKRLKPKEAK